MKPLNQLVKAVSYVILTLSTLLMIASILFWGSLVYNVSLNKGLIKTTWKCSDPEISISIYMDSFSKQTIKTGYINYGGKHYNIYLLDCGFVEVLNRDDCMDMLFSGGYKIKFNKMQFYNIESGKEHTCEFDFDTLILRRCKYEQ